MEENDYDEESNDSEKEVATLKVGLLQNIINILQQKMVLYSLQLQVYEKEETQIVFEEIWEDYYVQALKRSYFAQFKVFLEHSRIKKQKDAAIIGHMNDYRVSQIFYAWRQARPTRIAYQTRIQ